MIILARYKEAPLTVKAKTIAPGITKIKDCFCSIKSNLIAGSSK